MEDEENELFVEETTDVAENESDGQVEPTTVEEGASKEEVTEVTEPQEVTYSQAELDKILESRTNNLNRKHQKELAKYRNIENTLKQGLGADNLDEIDKQLKNFYKEQGVNVEETTPYRDEWEEKTLAEAEANNIISLGEAEMRRTANELATKKRTPREQEVFMKICNEITLNEAKKELKAKGVDGNIIDSDEFKKFASKFNYNTSIADIYDIYSKTNGTKKTQPKVIGSMKNSNNGIGEVKDFYTYEEAKKFTSKDLEKNPKLAEAIEKSMFQWK